MLPVPVTSALSNITKATKYKLSSDNTLSDVASAKKEDFINIQNQQLDNLNIVSKNTTKIVRILSKDRPKMRAAKISQPDSIDIFSMLKDLFKGGKALLKNLFKGGKYLFEAGKNVVSKVFDIFKGGKNLLGDVFKGGKNLLSKFFTSGAEDAVGDVVGDVAGNVTGSVVGDAAAGAAGDVAGGAAVGGAAAVAIPAAVIAAAAGTAFGAYEGKYGRQKALIEKLAKAKVVEYNLFGNSKILRWDIVSNLSLDQTSQLLSFDDWDDKTKAKLQQLVSAKTKASLASDKQGKMILKTKKDYNKFLDDRDKELRKKEGFFGYWAGKIVGTGTTLVETEITGGGLLSGHNPKEIYFYNQLQNAGVISYSIMPFGESSVLDWKSILKLKPKQIVTLLKLNWDKKTEARLKEILNTRVKQKYHVNGDIDKYIKSVRNHKVNLGHQKDYKLKHKNNAIHTVENKLLDTFGSNNIVNQLIHNGSIDHSFLGNSEITKKGWSLIGKLSPKQISQVIDYNDWDQETKAHLAGILQSKLKQGKSSPQLTKQQKPKTHTDVEEVAATPIQKQNTDTDLLSGIMARLDALIQVTVQGHTEQIKAAAHTAKKLVEKHIDEIKHPIMDTGKGL